MNICMLSWEYPPRIVGGISRHCHGLARALARRGHRIHLVTLEFPGAPEFEEQDGVKIYRVRIEVGHPSFLSWVLLFNHFMEKKVGSLARDVDFDLIHAHDWLVALAGIASKTFLGKPLVMTIHSTEEGRSQGIHTPDSSTLQGLEWWGTYEAKRLIVTTQAMRHEVLGQFHLPVEKVDTIPNAVDVEGFQVDVDASEVKRSLGLRGSEHLVLFVGRLTSQKGVEHLIDAFPVVLHSHPDARLVIIGDGYMLEELRSRAESRGVGSATLFTRFVSDEDLVPLLKSADVQVVPSIYEPFGIAALEGMAAGTPVVASSVGGLREVIQHGKTGVWVNPRDPSSIAWGIKSILSDRQYASRLVRNAKRQIEHRFNWDAVAAETERCYERAVH